MRIHIVTAEHFSVPGLVLKAFATAEGAEAEAAELVNVMVNDSTMEADGDEPGDWRAWLERLQDYHGAAHCYVEITETDLVGAPEYLPALRAVWACARGELERPVSLRQAWPAAEQLVREAFAAAGVNPDMEG